MAPKSGRTTRKWGPRIQPLLEPGEQLLHVALVWVEPVESSTALNSGAPIVGTSPTPADRLRGPVRKGEGRLYVTDRGLGFSNTEGLFGPEQKRGFVPREQVDGLQPVKSGLVVHFVVRFHDGSAASFRCHRRGFEALATSLDHPN